MPLRAANPEPIRHDGRLIAYEIAHRPRVTRRIHLELNERGRLRVVVPKRLSRYDIHRTLQDSADYVARFLDEARARRALQSPLRYAQGEKHLLLGRRYPLDISVRPDERSRVEWLSDRIRVIVPERPDAETVRAVLLDGYRRFALDEFAARLQAVSARAAWTRRRPPPLRVRRMKASWGTCSVDGIITLNPLLLRAPSRCVDYVIVHEVCHLREHNHSARFYALQEQLFPAWRQTKQHLFDRGHLYLQL